MFCFLALLFVTFEHARLPSPPPGSAKFLLHRFVFDIFVSIVMSFVVVFFVKLEPITIIDQVLIAKTGRIIFVCASVLFFFFLFSLSYFSIFLLISEFSI